MDQEVYFIGKIAAIFFSNPSNFYKVLLIEVTSTDSNYQDKELVVTGIIGDVLEDESYQFWGELTVHPKYGEQLKVTRYEKQQPTGKEGLVKYFASSHFPGIGPKTAKQIVSLYPDGTIDEILSRPDLLRQVLSEKKHQTFLTQLKANFGMEKVLSELAKYGLSHQLTLQIYEKFQDQTLEIIQDNPYVLVTEIKGVGFKTADKIAENLGISANDPKRYEAGLIHCLIEHSQETGDTYLPIKALLDMTLTMLEASRPIPIDVTSLAKFIPELIAQGSVQEEDMKVFDNALYFAEAGIQSRIQSLLDRKQDKIELDKLHEIILEVENTLKIQYDDLQKNAIIQAITRDFFILTGGPGTGKTTVIRGIIAAYAALNGLDLTDLADSDEPFPIVLAAPTGRAARRMSELTNLPAATIHRHLGLGTTSEEELASSEAVGLSGELIIIDEFSMVDTWLANQLFKAIPPSMKVILVGDKDQLPSVGPGQVFADLLKVPSIPAVKLEKIFRQGEDSTITTLAHAIKDGIEPNDLTHKKADRSYFEVSAQQVAPLVQQIATAWQARGNPVSEFQVLIPTYKGPNGITQINKRLQEVFNPVDGRLNFDFQDSNFRLGDKVLHLVNEASLNVFNGDIGYIKDLVPAKSSESKQDELFIQFDGGEVNYPRSEWYKITHAYAMSVHKAQGSEFATVVLPMVSSYHRMLERNLFYTAMTRAKKSLIILGEHEAISQAIARQGANRNTYLKERFGVHADSESLQEVSDLDIAQVSVPEASDVVNVQGVPDVPVDYRLTTALINLDQIDPLIGLEASDFVIFNKK